MSLNYPEGIQEGLQEFIKGGKMDVCGRVEVKYVLSCVVFF